MQQTPSDASLAGLQTLLQLHSNSLLQYSASIRPWVPFRSRQSLESLQQMAAEQYAFYSKLLQEFTKHRQVPPPRRIDPRFATLHDVSLEFVLPQLVEAQNELIHRCRQLQSHAEPAEEFSPFFAEALALAERHREQLKKL